MTSSRDGRRGRWARLVTKNCGPHLLELDLEIVDHQAGPGMWAAELAQLFATGDRVRVQVALAAPPGNAR